jgi:hypothetical protein
MRYLIILSISILCLSAVPKPNPVLDFTVLRAEKQTFYGGVAGSPVVTTYTLYARAKRTFKISVDSGWAEGKADRAYILLDSAKSRSDWAVDIGEIVRFQVQIKTASTLGGGNNQWQIPGSVDSKSPIRVKNLLCFRYKGQKTNYLTINTIKTIPPILGQ